MEHSQDQGFKTEERTQQKKIYHKTTSGNWNHRINKIKMEQKTHKYWEILFINQKEKKNCMNRMGLLRGFETNNFATSNLFSGFLEILRMKCGIKV